MSKNAESTAPKPIRLLPGVIIVALQWLARFVAPGFAGDSVFLWIMGGIFGGALATLVWWAFFSRVPHLERWGALVVIVVAVLVTPLFLHESIATGLMGNMFLFYVIPGLCLALVVWAAIGRSLSIGARRAALVGMILLACGVWPLVKTGGFGGALDHDFSLRWAKTPEERLLAETADETMATSAAAIRVDAAPEWPGFLGPDRDAVLRGARIETDWAKSPPLELWRRPIGPGWSSFAVQGDFLYTQEQRGDEEVVACYRASTGEPVWRHSDTARFWESIGGAGPRGTPSLVDGRVYSFGATGILNVLDATDGGVVWTRDAASEAEMETPYWGFSSSPLVIDDLVVVAVAGRLVAYDRASGDRLWMGPNGGASYSSPHQMTIAGIVQILLLNEAGLTSVAPSDGSVLWEHPWPGDPIVRPNLAADGDLLISVNAMSGIRRLSVMKDGDDWSIQERWTSTGLKPYYSEFVVHDGHAFGFDGSLLASIDLEDGRRNWKGGRYGAGQLFLLADQGLLVVLTENGELALVEATSDRFIELARLPAIDGKTWNHPVLAGDLLLVRNGQEMAAFRLALAG